MATLAGHLREVAAPLLCRADVSAAAPGLKVCVVGAAGGIGQPLSLLLKLSPRVHTLHLYDVVNTAGVKADVSHINTVARVRAFTGPAQLSDALSGCDLVVIPAGVPRKPGMTRDDLFNINAGIVKSVCEVIAKACPCAIVNIISNPVNSTVPIAAETFKKLGVYDPRRLFGVTHLDVMRARTFVAEAMGMEPHGVDVPVIGGHAGDTILPLLSQTAPAFNFTNAELAQLTTRIQNGGTEVVEAKAGAGSATLSMAAAAAEFADACMRGMQGEPGVISCAYVESSLTELPFFASKVVLGRNGIEAVLPFGPLSTFERAAMAKMLPELKASIEKGVQFAHK